MKSNIFRKIACLLLVGATTMSAAAQQSDADTAAIEAQETLSEAPVEAPVTDSATTVDYAAMGDSAYSADNFALAEKNYLQAIKVSGTSSVLFYNLGNAYYRQGNLGKALVNYERALKLDPTNSDARDNLTFVKSKITDRQIDDEPWMTSVWNSIVCLLKADTWAWISVVLFALFLAGIATYLFSSVVTVKKISFFGGIIVFLICGVSIVISFAAANRVENDSYAIILPPSAQLSTIPREARTRSEEAFLLHEGTKVEIVDSVSTSADGKWYEVRIGANDRAWIKASEVERI